MEQNKERLILVTNDDGFDAKGIEALTEVMKDYGRVVVVAPFEAQSGMGHAITIKYPLRLRKTGSSDNVTAYKCNGTPVDCVKIALDKLLDRKPDMLVSGINHGINSSISIFYSGTVSAAIEGSLNNIPSLAFSLNNLSSDADFSTAKIFVRQVIENIIANNQDKGLCLNVNIPDKPLEQIKGVKIARQTKGVWVETFDKRKDPNHRDYYWLTGSFFNHEDHAKDTDEWAVRNNYVAIVPVQVDMTSYEKMEILKKQFSENKK